MRFILVIIYLFFILIPLNVLAQETTDLGQEDLIIFYSNDIIGETEPCG